MYSTVPILSELNISKMAVPRLTNITVVRTREHRLQSTLGAFEATGSLCRLFNSEQDVAHLVVKCHPWLLRSWLLYESRAYIHGGRLSHQYQRIMSELSPQAIRQLRPNHRRRPLGLARWHTTYYTLYPSLILYSLTL